MKLSRARVLVQVLVHVVIAGHLAAYYLLGWKRVGGADVQAFFHDFLGSGLVSAGVVLAALAFAATLLFGRVFCGWGCHFGAFQDLAAWTMAKLGLRPAPIQTRLLHHLPWALLAFAFVLPPALRWAAAAPVVPGETAPPSFRLRLDLGGDPWANLPGLAGTLVT
ncbi:MAG: 4Fe-4S binding protein, partial [Thermoanaerobaculia bacterium]